MGVAEVPQGTRRPGGWGGVARAVPAAVGGAARSRRRRLGAAGHFHRHDHRHRSGRAGPPDSGGAGRGHQRADAGAAIDGVERLRDFQRSGPGHRPLQGQREPDRIRHRRTSRHPAAVERNLQRRHCHDAGRDHRDPDRHRRPDRRADDDRGANLGPRHVHDRQSGVPRPRSRAPPELAARRRSEPGRLDHRRHHRDEPADHAGDGRVRQLRRDRRRGVRGRGYGQQQRHHQHGRDPGDPRGDEQLHRGVRTQHRAANQCGHQVRRAAVFRQSLDLHPTRGPQFQHPRQRAPRAAEADCAVLHRRRHVRRAGGVAWRREAQADLLLLHARDVEHEAGGDTEHQADADRGGTQRRFLADHPDQRHAVLHPRPAAQWRLQPDRGWPGVLPGQRDPRRSHRPARPRLREPVPDSELLRHQRQQPAVQLRRYRRPEGVPVARPGDPRSQLHGQRPNLGQVPALAPESRGDDRDVWHQLQLESFSRSICPEGRRGDRQLHQDDDPAARERDVVRVSEHAGGRAGRHHARSDLEAAARAQRAGCAGLALHDADAQSTRPVSAADVHRRAGDTAQRRVGRAVSHRCHRPAMESPEQRDMDGRAASREGRHLLRAQRQQRGLQRDLLLGLPRFHVEQHDRGPESVQHESPLRERAARVLHDLLREQHASVPRRPAVESRMVHPGFVEGPIEPDAGARRALRVGHPVAPARGRVEGLQPAARRARGGMARRAPTIQRAIPSCTSRSAPRRPPRAPPRRGSRRIRSPGSCCRIPSR